MHRRQLRQSEHMDSLSRHCPICNLAAEVVASLEVAHNPNITGRKVDGNIATFPAMATRRPEAQAMGFGHAIRANRSQVLQLGCLIHHKRRVHWVGASLLTHCTVSRPAAIAWVPKLALLTIWVLCGTRSRLEINK